MDNLLVELANLIKALSEDNFNLLIKNYNKAYYDAQDVRLTNGPYDGGIDLEVRDREGKLIKRSIQITIQKSNIEKKLFEDVNKAKENAIQFDYLKMLDFYCSQPLSSSTKREYRRKAKVDYGIELEITDANDLSELSEEFSTIKDTVYGIFKLPNDNLLQVDKQTKVLYDLFTEGHDTSELKRQFLNSFILFFLFEHPNSTEDEIVAGLKPFLNDTPVTTNLIKRQISSLRVIKALKNGKEKYQVALTDVKTKEIEDLLNTSLAQEGALKIEVEKVLDTYGLKKHVNIIVEFLYKSFEENYSADVEELVGNTIHSNNALKKIHSDLIKFLEEKTNSADKAAHIARNLLEVCTDNEYLTKISASILFTKLYHSDKLDKYINQTKQNLILDTQILLRLVSLGININTSLIRDATMRSVHQFYDVSKQYKSKIKLSTTYDYITELASQIQEALKLQRFFSIEILQKFGSDTRNVIYNYFTELVESKLYDRDLTINDFVKDILDFSHPNFNSPDFIEIVSRQLVRIFEFMNVRVIYHEHYANFSAIKSEYETSLWMLAKTRPIRALENDVKTIIYLSSAKYHADEKTGIVTEPYLITWDTIFYDVRKRILNKFPANCYWYIYAPSKFVDRVSLMNFKLNPKSITNNIISITESQFNIASKTSFIDLMSNLFRKEDLTDLQLAHRLIKLEKQTKPTAIENQYEEVKEEKSPVADILLDLREYYLKQKNKFNVDNLISALEDKDNSDLIFSLILDKVNKYNVEKKLDDVFFKKFDDIIDTTLKKEPNTSDNPINAPLI